MEKINKLLKDLTDSYGIIALRADFASEIISEEERETFSFLSKKYNLELTVKVGGCDALNDIYTAKVMGSTSIIAPMVETPYALKKFVDNCKSIYSDFELQKLNLYPNIETDNSYKNLDEILSVSENEYIKGFVLGRDDMCASLGMEKSMINSDRMLKISSDIAGRILSVNKKFVIGGDIRPKAIPFLHKLENKISHFETRMIVFSKKMLSDNKLEQGIIKATEFEIQWLEYFNKSQDRIEMLKDSINFAEKFCNS